MNYIQAYSNVRLHTNDQFDAVIKNVYMCNLLENI